MKRVLVLTLALALLLSFAACKKDNKQDTTKQTAPQTVTEEPTSEITTAATTEPEKSDISFIYNGYWYKNEGNQVLALKFDKDGSLTVNTYRRKNITSASNEPDSIIYGSFKQNEDKTLTVTPDNEFPEVYYIYEIDFEAKSLTATDSDPQGSSKTKLTNFSELSKTNARTLLLGEN